MTVTPVKVWADDASGSVKYYIDGIEILGAAGTVPLANLSDYTRGDIIRGGATEWEDLAIGATSAHLESDGTDINWQVNLTMADDAWIGFSGAGRLVFDSTPAPDQVEVTSADLNFVTAAHGIIHTDGVAAGMVLRANGTRYVPSAAASTIPIAPVAQGDIIIADVTPAWSILTRGAAAGYALISTATTAVWDQTPAWTGLHSFAAGITFNGASGANNVTAPDNVAIAVELLDAGGIEYLRIVSTDAQPVILFNEAGTDVDFHVEASGVADALQVHGADGQITLGALGAGFVQSSAGGVLSSAAIGAGDLPAHTHSGAGQGGSLAVGTTDTDATVGSVFFAGTAGVIQQDNANLFWDNSNNWLGIETASPACALDVNGLVRALGSTSPASGAGVELSYSTGIGYVTSYDRTGTSYMPLVLRGDYLTIQEGSSEIVRVTGGDVGIKVISPSAQLHIDQSSSTGAQPVLFLDQGDVSEQCIQFSSDATDRDIHLWTINVTEVPHLDWDDSENSLLYSVNTPAGSQAAITNLLVLQNTTAGTAAVGFGTMLEFQLEDDGGAQEIAGNLGFLWTDDDDGEECSLFRLNNTYADGGKLGYIGLWSRSGIAAGGQVVVPGGTGDIIRGIRWGAVVWRDPDGGGGTSDFATSGGDLETPVGAANTVDVYDVGGNTLTLQLNNTGELTIYRSADDGDAYIYDAALWMIWI